MGVGNDKKQTNLEKLNEMVKTSNLPFLVYDVETTGVMNGNDNRITQFALAYYEFNDESNQYELKDNLFMLAKPDEDALHQIELNEIPNKENVERKLKQEFLYQKTKGLDKEEKAKYINKVETDLENNNEFINYVTVNFDRMKMEMENSPKLKDVLLKQGLTLDSYIREGKGLTPTEMQVGITAFLDKHLTKATAFVNNGTYYAKHYMDKEHLSLNNSADVTIDLTQAERSRHGGKSEWTSDISVFAKNYYMETGKEIKIFDALTKTLCMGEMTAKACGKSISHTSEEYLQSKVKESALSKDNDYVLSLSRANMMKWIPTDKSTFDIADYHFNNLEYVDFGNDRRYVDIDKMFEVNNNFEITLEGDKTPIKTWEELEAKIKSLNANISKELLEKIHDKYEEIKETVKEQQEQTVKPIETKPLQDKYYSTYNNLLEEIERKKREIDEMKRMEVENNEEICKAIEFLDKEMNRKFEQYENAFNEIREKLGVNQNEIVPYCVDFLIEKEGCYNRIFKTTTKDDDRKDVWNLSIDIYDSIKGNLNRSRILDNIKEIEKIDLKTEGFSKIFPTLEKEVQDIIRNVFFNEIMFSDLGSAYNFENCFNQTILRYVDKALENEQNNFNQSQKNLNEVLELAENSHEDNDDYDERDI